MLFDWYTDGDAPSDVFDGFTLRACARVFDALARAMGGSWRDATPMSTPTIGKVTVLSYRPAPEMTERQALVTTGVEGAVAAAREAAGDKDVCRVGGSVVTEALRAGLLDEVILHQVPVLLGGGRPFFQALPEHACHRLVEGVQAPGVTHLHSEIAR